MEMEQSNQSVKLLKTADKKEYMRNYMKEYFDKKENHITCEICYGTYRNGLVKKHNMSKGHLRVLEVRERIKNEGIIGQTSETTEIAAAAVA